MENILENQTDNTTTVASDIKSYYPHSLESVVSEIENTQQNCMFFLYSNDLVIVADNYMLGVWKTCANPDCNCLFKSSIGPWEDHQKILRKYYKNISLLSFRMLNKYEIDTLPATVTEDYLQYIYCSRRLSYMQRNYENLLSRKDIIKLEKYMNKLDIKKFNAYLNTAMNANSDHDAIAA